MVVDRGGLSYKIEVVDAFSAQTRRFREELLLSRKAFRALKDDVSQVVKVQRTVAQASTAASKASVQASNARTAALRNEARVQEAVFARARSQSVFTRQYYQSIGRMSKQQRAIEARDAIARQKEEKATTDATLRRIQAQAQQEEGLRKLKRDIRLAEARAAKERQVEADRLARTQAQAALAQKRAANAAAIANRRAAADAARLRKEILGTDNAASRLAFTFRRLFGVLAAFTLARQGLQAFGQMVTAGVRFNNTIQQSTIGMGGLISALSDVRDAQGRLLTGSEAFNASLEISKETVRQIRQDSLRTVATFEELLETNQIALGPGLAVGLKTDEIRQLALRVSQTMAAIGQEQNQQSEEIRSILTGAISQRSSRVAVVLGLTGPQIREMIRTGTQFEELMKRFEAFGKSADLQARGLAGTFARLRGVFAEVAGSGAQGLFRTLTDGLQSFIDQLTTLDIAGNILPSESATKIFNTLYAAIDRLAQRAFDFTRSLDLEKDVLPAVEGVIAAVEGLFNLIISIGKGASDAIFPVFRAIGPIILDIVRSLAPVLVVLAQMRVALLLIELPFRGISKLVGVLAFRFREVLGVLKLFPGELSKKQRMWGLVGIAITAAAVAMIPLTRALFETDLSLQNIVKLWAVGVTGSVDYAVTLARQLLARIHEIKEALGFDVATGFLDGVEKGLTKVVGGFSQALVGIFDAETANEIGRALTQIAVEENELRLQLQKKQIETAAEERERLEQEYQKRQLVRAEEIGKLLAESSKGAGFDEEAGKRLLEAAKEMKTALGDPSGFTATPRDPEVTEEQRQQLEQLREANALKQIGVDLEDDLISLRRRGGTDDRQALEAARLRVEAANQELRVRQDIADRKLAEADLEVLFARGDEQRNHAIEMRQQLLLAENLELDEILAKIKNLRDAEEEAALVAEGSIGQGLTRGLDNFANQFASAFKAGIAIAEGLMSTFASFVATSLVDALDPNQDFDLKERFARFLQDIARLIITQLVQLAIAKAILGFGTGPIATGVGLQGGGQVPGFAEGGKITPNAATHSKAVRRVRPRHLDSRDTTPIWAQPGEFMQPLHAVRQYGLDFMEALRRGAIDPSEARGLLGMKKVRRMRTLVRRGPGYATGGQIAAAQTAVSQASSETAGTQGAGPTPAYLVADEQTADRLLNGGRQSFIAFMRRHKGDINAALR